MVSIKFFSSTFSVAFLTNHGCISFASPSTGKLWLRTSDPLLDVTNIFAPTAPFFKPNLESNYNISWYFYKVMIHPRVTVIILPFKGKMHS